MIVRAVLQLAAAIQISFACKSGYDTWYHGYCMRYSMSTTFYGDGIKDCTNDGTHPPIIRSSEENNLLMTIDETHGKKDNIFLGMKCVNGYLKWWDGSQINYTNWDDQSQTLSCGKDDYYAVNKVGKWYKIWSLHLEPFDIFCQEDRPAQEYSNCAAGFAPVPNSSGNANFCYQVYTSSEKWQTAENVCYEQYSHLPVIHNPEVNNFVRRTAVANSFSKVHIGLQGTNENNFTWVDGSAIDYKNFETGFPAAGLGNRGALNVNSGGAWINTDDDTPLNYMCMQGAIGSGNPVLCPASNLTNSGTISSPGFPWHASEPCIYNLEVPSGHRVQIKFGFFDSNLCCDALYIYNNDGSYQTLTGSHLNGITVTSQDNFMKLSWVPKGGYGVRGFTANFYAI